MNSKYLDCKKLNLNTFIREAPPSSSEQKIPGFLFLKEFTSMCVLFVIFFPLIVAFGYKPLSFYLLPASQLFKVPIGHCYYLVGFSIQPLDPCPDTDNPSRECFAALAVAFLQEKPHATQRSDTAMSIRSS